MDLVGMYMLNTEEYEKEKIQQAIDILYKDRKNEFDELSNAILTDKVKNLPNWKEFILNFCLDIGDSFKTWTNQKPSKRSKSGDKIYSTSPTSCSESECSSNSTCQPNDQFGCQRD